MDDEAKLSKDAEQAWARLMRVSQALLARVEADVKEAGFPPLAWYDALLELKRAGDAGLRPYALQRAMLLAQYNLSRLTDRLAKAGYLERLPVAEDKRGQILRITPAGRELLKRMWPVYRRALTRHFGARLDEEESRSLSETLDKLK
jgi:DNA-binding MarR family transcriptional regulator